MSDVLLGALVGVVAGFSLLHLTKPMFVQSIWLRENYRGARLPVGVGMVLIASLLAVEGALAVLGVLLEDEGLALDGPRASTLLVVLSLGLLGLIDDLVGDAETKGFRGHLSSVLNGQLTTGGLKMFGGGLAALIVCAPYAGTGNLSVLRLIVDAALVALSANVGNLLDRRPGRVIKVSTFIFVVVLASASFSRPMMGPAIVFGAGATLLWGDLREQFMLGDVGANVLGGVVGLAIVMNSGPWTRSIAALCALSLNLIAERVSFSSVIDRVGILRTIDRVGRLPAP